MSISMVQLCAEKRRAQRCSTEPKCMFDRDDDKNNETCVLGFQKDDSGCFLKPCRCAGYQNEPLAGNSIMLAKMKKEMMTFQRGFIPKGPRPSIQKLKPASLWNENRQGGKYIIPYRFHFVLDAWIKQMVREGSYSIKIC